MDYTLSSCAWRELIGLDTDVVEYSPLSFLKNKPVPSTLSARSRRCCIKTLLLMIFQHPRLSTQITLLSEQPYQT